jgi:hypothetical protein
MKGIEMNNDDLIDDDLDLSEVDAPIPAMKSRPKRQSNRKQKVSRVPVDYDPFEETSNVSDGYQRPPLKCWVDEQIARPLKLPELSPLWREDIATMGTSDRRHRFLASIVAMVDGVYYVRRKKSGLWIAKKKASEVKNILWNEWGGAETELNIRINTIEEFMRDDLYVVLDQLVYVPGAGPFVEYKGKNCLNTHYERQLAFPMDAMFNDETEQLIELIVRNLLNHQVGDFADWYEAILDGRPSSIKWLFHWLARLYQRPGQPQSTALWFVGPAQGVGKGLFTTGLSTLLGSSNVKVASSEEFKSEWNDFLMNASVFVMDEVDFSSRKEANSKLKRLVGNKAMALRKRNHGEFEIPAVASFVFTTNNVRPIALDRDDRRNTFFETNGSSAAKERAKAFYRLGASGWQRAWEGLAELLGAIEIDEELIGAAHSTEVKERMISSGLDPFDEWLHSDATLKAWGVGEFAMTKWIKDTYVYWAKENAFRGCATTAYCQTKLDEITSEGLLSKELRKNVGESRPRGYVRTNPDCTETITSAKECPVISQCNPRISLSKMRGTLVSSSSC